MVILLSFLIVPINSYASEKIVVNDIAQIAIDLQKYQLLVEKEEVYILKVKNLHEINLNLENNTNLMIKQNDILKERIELLDKYTTQQDAVLDNFIGMAEKQKKMYEMILEEKDPSFFEKLQDSFGKIGIGIVVGILIVL